MYPVMDNTVPLTRQLIAFFCAIIISGCAIMPAVRVAGGAMTGYDAVLLADDYLPRENVDGVDLACTTDQMLERRLRERLRMNNLPMVSAHVIDRHAYLVGQFLNRSRADKAVEVAIGIQGLTAIHCKFYPTDSPVQAHSDRRLRTEIIRELDQSPHLKDTDWRVAVIQGNAILIGATKTDGQKTAALAIAAEVGGVHDVIDYITVRQQSGTK